MKATKLKSKFLSPQFFSLAFKILLSTIFEIFKKFCNFFVPQSKENLSKKLALVTGGANGLGRAFCMRLAAEKCDLAIVDIDIKNAAKTAKEIEEKFEVRCRAFECDIADSFAIEELKNRIESEMGKVDILVNNAGIIYYGKFHENKVEDIQKVVSVNLTSQILVNQL